MIKNKLIAEYLFSFPENKRIQLEKIHQIISSVVPEAEEVISYGMPAFKYHQILVYYAGHTHHVGFYPTNTGIEAFKHELSKWKYSKGSVQFPYQEELPAELIKNIVLFRKKEVLKRIEQKKKKIIRKSG